MCVPKNLRSATFSKSNAELTESIAPTKAVASEPTSQTRRQRKWSALCLVSAPSANHHPSMARRRRARPSAAARLTARRPTAIQRSRDALRGALSNDSSRALPPQAGTRLGTRPIFTYSHANLGSCSSAASLWLCGR